MKTKNKPVKKNLMVKEQEEEIIKRLERLEGEMSPIFDLITNNQEVILDICEGLKKMKPLFTKEELKFAISELKFTFESQYHNGDFKFFTECSDNSEKSFDKDIVILKSVIEKLKKEKKNNK